MKIPAIKGRMGDWIYYTGLMTFNQINEHVIPSIGEIYQATCLDNLLQRELTSNYHSIKNYLLNDNERFFNAIILAVFDGDPQWLEVEFPAEERDYTNVGFLQLSGEETIFPVDGQHRVKGIKEALLTKPELGNEQVPVIFIAHHQTDDGRKRTRKLFSTLNRRAKPVGKNQNIALDEDDVCSIITRDLLHSCKLFVGDNVLNHKGKQIPVSNTSAFTSLITLYQCVDIIVHWNMSKKGYKSSQYKNFLEKRPEDALVSELTNRCDVFFEKLIEHTPVLREYVQDTSTYRAKKFRNSEGGNILFRPVALTEYCIVALILEEENIPLDVVFQKMSAINLQINEVPWLGIIWDGKKIINRVSRSLIRDLFLYMTCSRLLGNRIDKFYEEYANAANISIEQAKEILIPFRDEENL